MLGPFPVHRGVTTHPALIKALVEYLKTRDPATIIVGDNPGALGYGENEYCAQRSGILEGSQGFYRNISRETIRRDIDSPFVKSVIISRGLLESDLVINLPKFKTHLQTIMTGAIKNMYGILVGGEKARLHTLAPNPRDFARILVDIYKVRIPDLTIMDAIIGMEGNGPSNGRLRNINRILASDSGVALDATVAYMMGIEPSRVDHLRIAAQDGLGDIKLERIEIEGSLHRISDFKLPLTVGSRGLIGTMINRYFYPSLAKPHLKIREKKCQLCKVCIKSCPAKAIVISREYPFIRQELCTACYCCYELCPHSAIDLTGWQRFIGWFS